MDARRRDRSRSRTKTEAQTNPPSAMPTTMPSTLTSSPAHTGDRHHATTLGVSTSASASTSATARHDAKADTHVFVLFMLLGLGSWITVNGVFAELPVFVHDLPEGWRIGGLPCTACSTMHCM